MAIVVTITIRLPDQLESELRRRLDAEGVALSDYVRTAIAEKLAREPARRLSPYELGQHLFGRYGDGDADGSEKRKQRIRDAVVAKHHRR